VAQDAEPKSALGRWRAALLNLIIVAATLVATLAVVLSVWSGSYTIEPITAPGMLDHETVEKDSTAARLRDEIGYLVKAASAGALVKPAANDATEPQISVVGTSLPLRYLAGQIRDAIGRPLMRIEGRISVRDSHDTPYPERGDCVSETGSVHLVLSVASSTTGPFFDCWGSHPAVLREGALATLEQIEPLTAASYLAQGDKAARDKARSIVERTLARLRRDEWPVWVQRSFSLRSDIPRAELVRANILVGDGDLVNAELCFNRANAEFRQRQIDDRQWYPALDGLATLQIIRGEKDNNAFALAEKFVTEALALEPVYDSALFHAAELADHQSRVVLRDFDSPETCEALKKLRTAQDRYEFLLSHYPDFTYAYNSYGIMLLQLSAFIKRNASTRCGSEDNSPDALSATVSRLEEKIESLFRAAVVRDPNMLESWFQWGILLFQKQQLDWFPYESRPARDRIDLLNRALGNYAMASKTKGSEAYIWYLRAQALEALLEMEVSSRETRTQEAVTAYCNSARFFGVESTDGNTSLRAARKLRAVDYPC
jgi:hypothetical protein